MQLPAEGIAYIQIIILIGSLILFGLTYWRAQKMQFNIAHQIQEYKRTRMEGRLIDVLIKVHSLMSKGIDLILMDEDITDNEQKYQALRNLMEVGEELRGLSWWCGSLQDTIGSIAGRMCSLRYISPSRRTPISGNLVNAMREVKKDISEWLKKVIDEGLVRFDTANPLYKKWLRRE